MGRERFSKVVSVLVTGIIAMSGLPSAVFADVINAPTYYSVQTGSDYEITTNVTSSWIYHTSVDFVISNSGDETIHNWYLTFNTPYVIDNIWNGTLYETDGNGTYTITSNGWNQDIHPGETVTVGATFSSVDEESLTIAPEWYLLNTEATAVDSSLYTLCYTEYSSWESGFTGQLTLQPQVDCQHWSLTFNSNREITAVSSAVLNTEGNGSYEITHDENNMRLFANNAYNFGIQGVNSEYPLEFTSVELTVVDLAYHLTDDADGNGVPDYIDFINGGNVVCPTPTPTEAPTVTPTEEPTPTPVVDYELDRDLDGLPDYIEDQIGTDPLRADTDEDGLSDYIEIMLGYDPTDPDSDDNTILDGYEDLDGDGLSNQTELIIGTDLVSWDTDLDNLSDGDEVNNYGTNPLAYDTDTDGLSDGEELPIGKNPLDPSDGSVKILQTLSTAINNEDDSAITSVDIVLATEGDIFYVAYAEDLYNVDLMSTDVYGRIGSPIGLVSFEEFDSATAVFHYDDTALGDTDEANLGILWYDEINRAYVIQEQAVTDTNENTISVELDHFSTYVVVDLEKWNDPIIPDYSDRLLIAQHEDEYDEWGATPPSAEDYEQGCFNWWNLPKFWAQFERVQTISRSMYCVNPDESFRYWHYEYTWLVMDMRDDDGDDVPDFLERQGIMGPNRHLYYSDPSLPDTDGDGLTDGEEFGDILYCVNYNGQLITNSDNSQGCYLPTESGKSIVYARLHSYADKTNSDFDTLNDAIDSFPLVSRESIIYILYACPDGTNEGSARAYYCAYRNCGLNCVLMGFNGVTSFISVWDSIGRYNYSNNLFTSDDFYHVTDVVLVTHGQADYHYALLSGGSALVSSCYNDSADFVITPYDLSDKAIDNLHLRTCYAGIIESDDSRWSLSEDFLISHSRIERVYSFDCSLNVYGFDDGRYSLLGITQFNVINIFGSSYYLSSSPIQDIHQQVCFVRDDYVDNLNSNNYLYSQTINGINISCFECYENDIRPTYTSSEGLCYEYVDYIYHFDPILERYGYEF